MVSNEIPSQVREEALPPKTSPSSVSPEAAPRFVDSSKKSASLPHGAALSSPKVVRSRSNVAAGISGATSSSSSFRKRNSSETEADEERNAQGRDEPGKTEEDNFFNKKDQTFFGRLLPRRSGKKKKSDPDLEKDSNAEPAQDAVLSDEEKSGVTTLKSISRSQVERRQRAEPLNVPPSFQPPTKKEEVADFARNRMKTYSVSPPRNPWPAVLNVAPSTSPPAAVWPERPFSVGDETDGDEWKNARRNAYESNWQEPDVKRVGGRVSPVGRFIKNESCCSSKRTRREISPVKARRESSPSRFPVEPEPSSFREKPPIQKSHSFRNFSAQVDDGPRFFSSGQEKEAFSKAALFRNFEEQRLPKGTITTEKPKRVRKEESRGAVPPLPLPRKSVSLESVGSIRIDSDRASVPGKASSSESCAAPFPGSGFVVTHEEPEYANLEKLLPVLDSFETVHYGYENVQIIELVREESRSNRLLDADNKDKIRKKPLSESEVGKKLAKPPIALDKPKEPEKDAVPEFMRVQLNKVESRNSLPSATTEKNEVVPRPRPKSTLVERRKSELLLTAEQPEEKNFKPKIVSLKKQTSMPETVPRSLVVEKSLDECKKPKPTEQTASPEKKQVVAETCEVVLRKKPVVSQKEDQPELMKVFARRSLKIKEDDPSTDDLRKSRDSDKENEISESPKEERKRSMKGESEQKPAQKRDPSPVKPPEKPKGMERPAVDVAPLTPARTWVFPKYGRACSETAIGNFSGDEISETTKTDSLEESGFKRIQQRKAEWEKRMQQAAKP